MLNKQLLICSLFIILILAQPLTFAKTASAQQPQKLSWNSLLDSKKSFGPTTPITIDSGEVEHIISCNGENSRVSNFDWTRDLFYTVSDIYISKSPTNTDLNRGNPAFIKDVNNAFNTVVTDPFTGLFDDFTIGSTINIGNGKYDVIYDECQDRRFQQGEDAIFEEAITVEIPINFNLTSEARETFISSKLTNGKIADNIEEIIEYINYIYTAYKFLKWGKSIKNLKNPAPDADLDKLQSDVGKTLVEIALVGVKTISTDFGTNIEIPTSLTGLTKIILVDSLQNLVRHYRQIAADPPNINYRDPVMLDNKTVNLTPIIDDKLNNLTVSLINELENERIISEAFLSTLEKFQGAQINGDSLWGLNHAQSLKKYSKILANQLSDTNSIIDAIAEVLRSDYSLLDSDS